MRYCSRKRLMCCLIFVLLAVNFHLPIITYGAEPNVRQSESTDFQKIQLGSGITYALDKQNRLWTWGGGFRSPSMVPFFQGRLIKDIQVTYTAIQVLLEDGTIWVGYKQHDQSNQLFGQVKGLPHIQSMQSASYYSYGFADDGTVWEYAPFDLKKEPRKREDLKNSQYVQYYGYFAVKKDGTVWRINSYEGNDEQVVGLSNIKKIATADQTNYAITNDGKVWGWGNSKMFSLDLPFIQGKSSPPVLIPGLDQVKDIAAGSRHFAVLKEDGSVWAWGRNDVNQLGDGTTNDSDQPKKINNLAHVAEIICGDQAEHTLAVLADGTLMAWGKNNEGETGVDPDLHALVEAPTAVKFPVQTEKAVSQLDLRRVNVIVNGRKVKFPDTEPYIDDNGRTMVPVRFVGEKLGGTVAWDPTTSTVTIKYKSKEISLPLNSNVAKADGQAVTLDTTAVLFEGRTMVPLRFVSEAMSSKVSWDGGAHTVQISDSEFQSKVAQGLIKLDPWGREISDKTSNEWNILADLPDYVYELPVATTAPTFKSNKSFFADDAKTYYDTKYLTKENADKWADLISQYYAVMLNVDYRTIDESVFVSELQARMKFGSSYYKAKDAEAIKDYVQWVKDNHIIAKGYADPEQFLTYFSVNWPVMRTHFKFMIIQADDPSQTFMDNYAPSEYSESPSLKTGVWYDGYADVGLVTNYGNYQEDHLGVSGNENMFIKGHYKYEEVSQ